MEATDQGHESQPDAGGNGMPDRYRTLEAVLALAGSAVFFLLLVSFDLVTPPLLGLTTLLLLWPIRKYRTVRAVFVSVVFLLIIWFLNYVGVVIAPFIAAFILAYVFDPIVSGVEKRFGIPRWVSSSIVTVVLVGLVVLFFALLMPTLVNQLRELATELLDLIADLPEKLMDTGLFLRLEAAGLVDATTIRDQIPSLLTDNISSVLERMPSVFRSSFRSLNTLIGAFVIVAILPVVLFYTIRDLPRISEHLIGLLPTVSGKRSYLAVMDQMVGRYLRGQLLVSLIAAINVGFWLTLFNVPYSLLIAVLAGVLNLIPQIGALITNIIATLITIAFADPILAKLIVVQAVLLGQSLLEQSVLTPKIIGDQVGLHPVLVILALLVFGKLMGFVGLLIAVPLTSLLVILLRHYPQAVRFDLAHYGKSDETV